MKKITLQQLMSLRHKPIKPDNPDDDELLDNYRQSGDITFLGKLFERYMPLIYGVCLKYLKDEETAKDAVMSVFEELIVKVKQHEVKQFRGWLYVLTRNYCLMQLRSDKKMETIALDDVMEFTTFLHPEDNNKEAALTALERCMQKLPVTQKESINLFYLQEKCYKEITDITGFTLNEVKSYIQNGKRNLKICLDKNND
ncbi:RNA polymerase sigma factor [Mucilaginibacter sp. X5P1]|uniref:RNA polymerase sigma factor n=1 Tax=Mucilaginibacter sp. X5P1 TaxID=2723088 RepID=UPI00180A231A|nr:RNA polymerase sigma-70 factor (ECF subfamily) [Mucilaginibacter sp. X5P1]